MRLTPLITPPPSLATPSLTRAPFLAILCPYPTRHRGRPEMRTTSVGLPAICPLPPFLTQNPPTFVALFFFGPASPWYHVQLPHIVTIFEVVVGRTPHWWFPHLRPCQMTQSTRVTMRPCIYLYRVSNLVLSQDSNIYYLTFSNSSILTHANMYQSSTNDNPTSPLKLVPFINMINSSCYSEVPTCNFWGKSYKPSINSFYE